MPSASVVNGPATNGVVPLALKTSTDAPGIGSPVSALTTVPVMLDGGAAGFPPRERGCDRTSGRRGSGSLTALPPRPSSSADPRDLDDGALGPAAPPAPPPALP